MYTQFLKNINTHYVYPHSAVFTKLYRAKNAPRIAIPCMMAPFSITPV
jgi:hypothetical protein